MKNTANKLAIIGIILMYFISGCAAKNSKLIQNTGDTAEIINNKTDIEQKLREQKLKEQKLREQKLKEQKLKEQKLKEQKLKEQKLKEQKLKEQKLKEQKLKEQKLREQIVGTIHKASDSISAIYKGIEKIQEIKQGQFEKASEFNERKRNLIDNYRIFKGEILSSNILPGSVKYDADKEVWKIEFGEYKRSGYKTLDRLILETEIVYNDTEKYEASNAMGATVTVTKYSRISYGAYITNKKYIEKIKRKLSDGYTNRFVIKMPMPIEDAKKYGEEPNFKYRLVYRLDGGVNNHDILGKDNLFTGPTINDPVELALAGYLLRINPLAILVYESKNNSKVLHYYKF